MNAKIKLARWVLNRRVAETKREVQVHNFDTAKTVGVLWNSDETEAYRMLKAFLDSKRLQVTSLCYRIKADDEVPDLSFGRKQTNWLGFPQSTQIAGFENTPFDLLIDLTIRKRFPLQVVLGLSQAKFKAGYCTGMHNFYDLSIDIHQNPDPLFLVEQLKKYLNQINKTEEE